MRLANTFVVLVSVLLSLCALELVARLREHQLWGTPVFTPENFFVRKYRLMNAAGAVNWDADLGWVTSPEFSGQENMFGTRITVHEDGIRGNGDNGAVFSSHSKKILAVGDSLTWGDQVSDHESWPSYLEALTGNHVLNAGIGAQGLDQSLLRVEKLVPKYKPDILILSFAISGINRSEWKSYPSPNIYAPKPYFEIQDQKLVVKNQPVPKVEMLELALDPVHKWGGYSYVVNKIMLRWFRQYWMSPFDRMPEEFTGYDGTDVGCLIMDRLKVLSKKHHMRTIVLQQYWYNTDAHTLKKMQKVASCIDKKAIEHVDLYPFLQEVRVSNPSLYDTYWIGHMSGLGNRFVAEHLKDVILSPAGKRLASR